MSFFVMILVLFAALLHASWNFLVKRMDDKYLSMSGVVIGHAPFAMAALLYAPLPDPGSLPYLISGVMLHVGYQLFLLNSYRLGDLTQVYPLARGVAPVFVAIISVILLGVSLSWIELSAILVIGAGIMSLALVGRHNNPGNGHAASLAILTGGFIAAYSLVDGFGAREAGTALGFYGWLSIINSLLFAGIMGVTRPGLVRKVICQNWRFSLMGGGISFCAYAMVTWAFTMAPIALVTALRETSIVFALLLGVFVLKETMNFMKIFTTITTLLGVILLRLNPWG